MHPHNIDTYDHLVEILVVTIWAVLTPGLVHIIVPSGRSPLVNKTSRRCSAAPIDLHPTH